MFTMHRKYRKIYIFCSIVSLITSIVITLVALILLIWFILVDEPADPKLGLEGDTIVVSDFKSFGLASVTITDCAKTGDNTHPLKAALVKKSNVIRHMMNNTGTMKGSVAHRVSLNLCEDKYFLQDSFMSANICLSSQYSPLESSRAVTVFTFVFDSLDDNANFLANKTDGNRSALYSKALQVGTTSKPICTWVNYSVPSPAYYYLALGEYPLGTLTYSADLYQHVMYLNFSDYKASEQRCSSVSEMQPYELHKPLKHKEYFLVSYICSSVPPASLSTHVCAKFKKQLRCLIILIAVFGAFAVFVVAIIFVLCKCEKNSPPAGYEGIRQ